MMTPTTSLIAAVVIRVAPNLINEIIGQLRDDVPSLRQCSLVSKKWRGESLKWLFAVIAVEITVADPWSYLRWTGEPVPGFHLATTHAREMRLVQSPSLMWITPWFLSTILPQFSAFKNVTSLSFHSFSIHRFDDLTTQPTFGHFFPTVRKLDLENPQTTANGLLLFLRNFIVLDDLGISDPEWGCEADSPNASDMGMLPPLCGRLRLSRLRNDSTDFISLLAGLPIAFQHVSLVNCQLPFTPINLLLRQLSSKLKSFSASSCFASGCFPNVDLSNCARVEEVHFFAGEAPAAGALDGIYPALGSVSSARMRTIALDLNAISGPSDQDNPQRFPRSDAKLRRIALAHQDLKKTVVRLSASNPFTLELCLRRVRQSRKLVLGT